MEEENGTGGISTHVERGTNENTYGLLRHYFPKGIYWRWVSEKQLAWAAKRLNKRPSNASIIRPQTRSF